MATIKEKFTASVETLKRNKEILSPCRDAELLFCHSLGCGRSHLYLRFNEPLTGGQEQMIDDYIRRRRELEPVAYLTGSVEFYGFEFTTRPGVFIPRQETEVLIDVVRDHLPITQAYRFLDLGTGTGVIIATLLKLYETSSGLGIDRSPSALALAQTNARSLGVESRVTFIAAEWFAGIQPQTFDCIVTNPPYVASKSWLSEEVKQYEPSAALISGDHGLADLRIILDRLPDFLKPDGIFIAEIAEYNSRAVVAIVKHRFPRYEIIQDLAGRDRFLLIIR